MVRFIKKRGIVYLFIAGLVFYQSANDYLEIGGSPVFNTDKGAMELWVRPIKGGEIFSYGYDCNAHARLIRYSFNQSTRTSDMLAITRVGGVQHPYTWLLKNANDFKVPEDKWHHVVLSHDGKVPGLYINGELQTYIEKGEE